MIKLRDFDASEFLHNDEEMAEYLTAAIEENNPQVFLAAIADVAKAKGMTEVAKQTGLGRESLYKALKPGAKPRFETIQKVLDCLGIRVKFEVTNQI